MKTTDLETSSFWNKKTTFPIFTQNQLLTGSFLNGKLFECLDFDRYSAAIVAFP